MSKTIVGVEVQKKGHKNPKSAEVRKRVLNLPLAKIGDSHRNRRVIEENRRIQDKIKSYKETVH